MLLHNNSPFTLLYTYLLFKAIFFFFAQMLHHLPYLIALGSTIHACPSEHSSNNEYLIVAHKYNQTVLLPDVYLGASAVSRRPRSGETWQRGNGLADGNFCEETWRRIMTDIVRYEAEEVKSEKWKEAHVIPYETKKSS